MSASATQGGHKNEATRVTIVRT